MNTGFCFLLLPPATDMTCAASMLLAPFSTIYSVAIKTRNSLYEHGFFKPVKLDAIVISVGNITAGGTGKTPLVEYVARIAAGSRRKVCILTRGYGRLDPSRRVLVSDGHEVLANEGEAGDEPLLLAEKLCGVAAVISDSDRTAAARWAIENLKSDTFVLDDGFQHLQLARNLNIVAVDATNPWDNGLLLPGGLLREPKKGIARADCVVITRADQATDTELLLHELETLIDARPTYVSRMRFTKLRQVNGAADADADKVRQIPAAAFSGIGNQSSFAYQLQRERFKIVSVSKYGDHHRYSQADLDGIVAKAKAAGAQCLITTAKDAVKLSALSIELPCYVLEIEIEIDQRNEFEKLILASIN
ncbi:MAG TPA: tetraacyldisaccharide 4'-kinase [Pyrinomonadaceae bacterium]|jgi:tetraacyldisaccharide 4'-kinase|nr:tetraacyldisaccharide 4'-kinase [Pyrinomonadaceae bacterium]